MHVGIDDAARRAYSEVLPDERKASAVPFLERAVAGFARHGVTVERVMTDNGSAYRSHDWRLACGGLARRHLRTRRYTPRTNGKAERFIQTSLRAWASARPFATSPARTAALIPLAGPRQHRPAARRPGPPAARYPPAPTGVPRFDRGHRSSVPTYHPARAVRRSGARSAAGARRQPAQSVLAPPRRTGHASPKGGSHA